jgi:ATP-binding cassette subfamily G (WHITE) protein 2
MATLIGGVFFQIGTTQASIAKRLPVLFFCCINQGIFGAMSTVNSFPAERVLTLRERASGMYFVSAYFAAKTTAESLVYLITPVFFSSVAYWMIGLQASSHHTFSLQAIASCAALHPKCNKPRCFSCAVHPAVFPRLSLLLCSLFLASLWSSRVL